MRTLGIAQRVLGVVILCGVMVAGAAQAQFMTDQLVGNTIGAKAHLNALTQSTDAATIVTRLRQQGYTDVQINPSNPREATAMSPAGFRVKLLIDRTTGQIISAVPQ